MLFLIIVRYLENKFIRLMYSI